MIKGLVIAVLCIVSFFCIAQGEMYERKFGGGTGYLWTIGGLGVFGVMVLFLLTEY